MEEDGADHRRTQVGGEVPFSGLDGALAWLDSHIDFESKMPSRRALPTLERKGGPLLTQAFETLASAEERSGRAELARQYHEKALIAAAVHAAETG